MTIQVPPHLVPIIQQASQQTGIPFNILAAKLSQESNFNPNARGAAGEIGIAQIMPRTAASMSRLAVVSGSRREAVSRGSVATTGG